MKTKYDEVLNMFIGDDELRPWMQKSFEYNGFAMATDAHSMIVIDRKLAGEVPASDYKQLDKVFSIIPTDININRVFALSELYLAIEKAPLKDEYETTGKYVECSECDGEGYVEWEYKHYTDEKECPVCNGDGAESRPKSKKTGKQIPDELATIKINNSGFSIRYIKKLVATCEALGEMQINLLHMAAPNKASLFQIGEVRVLLMPVICDKETKIYHTINV
jgi:hypothetical protein